MQPLRRIVIIVRYGETELIELFCGAMLLSLGLLLIMPGDQVFRAAAFHLLARQFDEWVFALVCLVVGAAEVMGALTLRRRLRLVATALACSQWTATAIAIVLQSRSVPFWLFATGYAAACWLLLLRGFEDG